METIVNSPVRFTAGALKELKRLLQDPSFDTAKKLRVGVKGGGCSGMTYILDFEEKREEDKTYEFEGVPYIMANAHEIYLYGMEIDWQDGLHNRGFVFKNPNASTTCGCGTSFAV
ncbi:MAG TPA: iron-sulfur cluster assembly accessory protein [Chitinophagaceae bacterium]|jgi:iron-sulfur cluster assembly protein|nr:iron-sulfur cluster assembly accessory protein [Chitinophagaceae bacterium]